MKMIRPLLTALALAGTASFGHAASSLDQYDARPERAPQGKLVNYVKSNLDGSKRLVLSLYFHQPFEVEALKVEADGRYMALVKAKIDPKTLTENWIRSYNGLENGPGKEKLQMQTDGESGSPRLVAQVAGTQMPVTPAHLPAHIYNFDLTGLNLTLPLLKNPRADFQIGIVDPDFHFLRTKFKPNAGLVEGGFVDKGVARFRYLRDEKLDDVDTHRFEVSGPAFKNLKGTLWVNAKDHLIERFEHQLPDNPDWKNFKLSRLSDRPMDGAGWDAFKAATVTRAMALVDPE